MTAPTPREVLHEKHTCLDCGAIITIPYARPALTRREPLDVERLARAIGVLAHSRCCWDAPEDAKDIAAEYARLEADR